MGEKKKWNIADSLAGNIKMGDKVVWIIVVLLIMLSLVSIFSSTSLMAIKEGISRTSILLKHLQIVGIGALILVTFSIIPSIKVYRQLSRWGFLFSLVLLLWLDLHIEVGQFIRVRATNGAFRSIIIGGFSLQVFEVVKVAMVMYLSWAIQAYETGKFSVATALGTYWPKAFGWLKGARAQRWVFIFLPIITVIVLILPGSTGSALLTGIVMFATILIGGVRWKDLIGVAVVATCGIALLVALHIVSSGKVLDRMQTAFNRLKIELPYPDAKARETQKEKISMARINPADLEKGTKEFNDYLDLIRQPDAAEIAIVQGGRRILGKGPGKSTQKYIVPVMFEDYMFSFIVEEYGLLVGFIVILMYMSLFARGAIIVHNCSNRYAKTCVGGLVFLITFQALFHIMVNCNIGIVTGQTLPLISHGRCSFLCFCIAFGVILSISKIANEKIKKQQMEEEKLMAMDDVSASLTMVEEIDEKLENQ